MDYNTTITSLFYLLIYADGSVNEKELNRGKQMMVAEGINEEKFKSRIEELSTIPTEVLYNNCLSGLRKMNKTQQIKAIAWLCVVANADGFMDKKEWMLIYKIYHTELGLQLDEVMKTQRELNKVIHGKEFNSFGVWMNRETQSSK
jgi:uncharacterized tellurite resistance protein B-like protein